MVDIFCTLLNLINSDEENLKPLEIEDMIRLGAYKKGHDLRSDRSVELRPLIESFLKQTPEEKSDFHTTVSALEALVAEDSSENTL
mgnify:CR=1 FL=1